MGRGRSLPQYERVYISGYDMSGHTSDAGERGVEYAEPESYCFSDAVAGTICGVPKVTFGPLNGVFDNTATTGLAIRANAQQGSLVYIMHARGVLAVPAIGDDAFCAPMYQTQYKDNGKSGLVTAQLSFAGPDVSVGLNYDEFFGTLLHPWGAETDANADDANADNGAATSAGGWMMYQVYSISGGAGTAEISIDDSANGTDWLALSGATSGAIGFASAPTAGIVQLATNATVRRYLRWQLALAGGATGATFSLAFMRGR